MRNGVTEQSIHETEVFQWWMPCIRVPLLSASLLIVKCDTAAAATSACHPSVWCERGRQSEHQRLPHLWGQALYRWFTKLLCCACWAFCIASESSISMCECFSHVDRKPGNPNQFFSGAIQVRHVAASLSGVGGQELYVWSITRTFWSPLCSHLLAKSEFAFAVCFSCAVAGVSVWNASCACACLFIMDVGSFFYFPRRCWTILLKWGWYTLACLVKFSCRHHAM